MRIDIRQPESQDEIEIRRSEDAVVLSELYNLPLDVTRRIVEMAANIDQAHAIAELMR
jgi:hypothetical protein